MKFPTESAKNPLQIRKIEAKDNAALAAIIREVMTSFGACGEGFSIMDAEVDAMWEAYSEPRSAYWVVTNKDKVLGGAGIAPLKGSTFEICELKKMYFRPELQGLGFGQKLLDLCVEEARKYHFQKMYLETLSSMERANRLYLRNEFHRLPRPMGRTGHFKCDVFYCRSLI